MLVKTNLKTRKGAAIYRNALTGESGTLPMAVNPSTRFDKRHKSKPFETVKTNRKATPGRVLYYQHVKGKTIKHIQETPDAIQRKTALFNFFHNLRSRIAKIREEKRKQEAAAKKQKAGK